MPAPAGRLCGLSGLCGEKRELGRPLGYANFTKATCAGLERVFVPIIRWPDVVSAEMGGLIVSECLKQKDHTRSLRTEVSSDGDN